MLSFLDEVISKVESKKIAYLNKLKNENQFLIHIFKNDSLIYWNSNKTPVSRFVDMHFPSNGLSKLQNGWYFSKAKKINQYIVSCSFLVRNDYLVENEYLANDFTNNLTIPFEASIILDKDLALPVFTSRNKYLFSIQPEKSNHFSDFQSNLLLSLYIGFLTFLCIGVFKTLQHRSIGIVKTSIFIFLIIYFLLVYYLSNNLRYITFLEPTLFGNSLVFPNFFVLISHVVFITFLWFASKNLWLQNKIILLIASGVQAFFLVFICQSLVKDSSIPLEIDKLFQLNSYSFWSAICIGLAQLGYLMMNQTFFKLNQNEKDRESSFVILFFVVQVLSFIATYFLLDVSILTSVFPLILSMIFFLQVRKIEKFDFKFVLIYLFTSCLFLALLINESYVKKEFSQREVYAKQLASEQDISAEIEFDKISSNIQKHHFFEKYFQRPSSYRVKELKNFMDKTFYKEFWDRYEVEFTLYDPIRKKNISSISSFDISVEELEDIILKHSRPSEINKNLFYIKDYTSQLSYVSRINIKSPDNQQKIILYAIYKSKRIPQKLGFPKLLLSSSANVLSTIENYSIAKYYDQKLVSQHGDFSYPYRYKSLLKNYNKNSQYYHFEDFDHYVYQKNSNDVIVLSKREFSTFQLLTSFSYLSCFYGFLLVIFILFRNLNKVKSSTISFALKIQLSLIGLILVSLLSFGLGSGVFVQQQYNEYAAKLIKEKIYSVNSELKSNNATMLSFSIEDNGDYLNALLGKLARVFVTDINMYDKNGYLLATSRQKLFNLGLISEQINPEAFNSLKTSHKNEFIQNENIGKLNYLSAYFPLYNKKGSLMSYINLQYFGQQEEFVKQIEKFLVSIINTFILLLVFAVIIAVVVSNWLTNPLRILQASLSNVQMGKYNEPIVYASNDEIGELVKNYNQKLNELAFTANQLAQSEREFAWREMAKQVAHEIKNPLTPMKLSLQHLQRVYDPKDPISSEKLNKIVLSLVEQIDTLSQIANEFSNFAKLPKEHLEEIDILPVLHNVVFFFQQENKIAIQLKTELLKASIKGDKNLLLQVFNNIITNSIQALGSSIDKPMIEIELVEKDEVFILSFTDNGSGIPMEMREKIFEPNFTTKTTGSGLGLALSKQIVQAHHGKINFETELNLFTRFVIELPKI